jgi:4,5-dihydroxyphthalate decarboxylase
MPLTLSIACGDYDRTRALMEGIVKPEGLALRWLAMSHGEMWQRILNESEVQASELSLAWHVIARTLGKPLVAIPVFPARAFRHSYIFINTKSDIRDPRDLMGKKVGVGEFPQTAAVIARAVLQHEYDVELEKIKWFTWGKQTMELKLPARYEIHPLPEGKSPDRLLMDGELDALMLSSLFPSLARGAPNVRRLFENYQEVEIAYFKKTGIFPIMHTVVMREDLWKEHPWIATSLYKAFQKSKQIAYERLDDLSLYKLSLAWFREPMARQREALGEDPWCDGVETNRHSLETLVGYLYEQEMIKKKPRLEELFAPNTLTLT